MNWINNPLDLGIIKENTAYNFEFIAAKTLEIESAKAGCSSCTSLHGYSEGRLRVKYKSSSIPIHLNSREQRVEKNIVVKYRDKTTEVLKFTAIVRK